MTKTMSRLLRIAKCMIGLAGLVGVTAAAPTQAAGSECRQALALGLDVSGSVDGREYQLQMQGLANALIDPSVQAALLALPGQHVELMVFEWSGPQDQHVVLDWRALTDPQAIAGAADQLRMARRQPGDPSTALGAAMIMGTQALQRRPCRRRVLDLSGDGTANSGPLPQMVQLPQGADITVNGLVIANAQAQPGDRHPTDPEGLVAYFQAFVIRGPQAFTELALGFESFQAAMTRKLIRELSGLELVQRPHPPYRLAR